MIDLAALAVVGTVTLAALYLWVIHGFPFEDRGASAEWLDRHADPDPLIPPDWVTDRGRGPVTARPEPDPRPPLPDPSMETEW